MGQHGFDERSIRFHGVGAVSRPISVRVLESGAKGGIGDREIEPMGSSSGFEYPPFEPTPEAVKKG